MSDYERTVCAPPGSYKANTEEGVGNPPTFFERILLILFIHEGEWMSPEAAKRMGDPSWCKGGTMMGITQATLDLLDPGMRAEHVDEAYAREFYFQWYWGPVRSIVRECPAITAMVFDAGVQHGPHLAISMLQQVVGADVDGIAGNQTNDCISYHGAIPTILGFSRRRRELLVNWVLRDLDERPGFGRDEFLAGVIKRVDTMESLAFELLNEDSGFHKFNQLYKPGLSTW